MSIIYERIKKNYKFLGTLFMFIVAFILMIIIMPREHKFTYEFYKGRPWSHEDFTARFKFPIYKTDEELKIESDSASREIRYYFSFNAYLFAEQLNIFKEIFDKEWVTYSLKEFKIPSEDIYLQSSKYKAQQSLQKYFHDFLYLLLEKVYLKGVVEIPENEEIESGSLDGIVLVRGNIAEEKDISDLFTPKSAYEYVRTKVLEELSLSSNQRAFRYHSFFENLEIERFIKPNVFYDAVTTEMERKSRFDEISLTKGMVQEGELIISKGEIVTQEKYQVLQSLKMEYEIEKGNVGYQFVRLGKMLLLVIILVLIYTFLYNFRRTVLKDFVKTGFILFMVVLMVLIASITAHFGEISFYIIPFTILPILLRTFYDERIAVFIHVITVLVIGFIAPNSYEFVFLTITAGIAGIFSLTNLYRRSRFFLSAFFVVITYCIAYFGISVVQESSFSQIEWKNFGYFGINGVLILISFQLIYVFEKTFGFLSDTTLMELSDTNQPLLRKLAEIAPGTFQHSLQVANLSEEAIFRIGGNPLLIRTGALYHDIGKMYNPVYFIENQTKGINPHDNLEFEESAKIIIDHVSKGVELAKKNKLPKAIIDFIRTHHGTSTVQYFYRSYIKKYPEKDVDLMEFSYPGPKPISKEMSVFMMADAVEAASRSMLEYSQESISALVEKIITIQLNEGQFEEATITFREIKKVKEVFNNRLRNIYHARISYPK